MDIDSIGRAYAAVEGSIKIAKALAGASSAIEVAELKLRAAELINSLADIKIELAASKDEKQRLQHEIEELRGTLQLKATVVRLLDAFYTADAEGKPTGDPFCSRCWQVDHRLIYLSGPQIGTANTNCTHCKSYYASRRTPFSAEKFIEANPQYLTKV